MREPFLAVINRHVEICGEPPEFKSGEGYLSYFENSYGEQWVFAFDRENEVFTIYGGDINWANPRVGEKGLKSLVFNQAERLWILACLEACGLKEITADVVKAWADFDHKVLSYSKPR